MKPTIDPDKADMVLPNITVKITRAGHFLKFKAGKYTLELVEVPGKSQTYPLLLLDKYITQVTTNLLQEQVTRQNNIEELRQNIKGLKAEKDTK